ncbi:MAG: hypothetical protein ACXQTZ_04505 [Candidatus Alkanophagales archaeon]
MGEKGLYRAFDGGAAVLRAAPSERRPGLTGSMQRHCVPAK